MSDNTQRSVEWYEAKLGKFSSSRIGELMGVKGLGLTGESYAAKMANEIFAGRDDEDSFVSYDMKRGIELEPYAFDKFKALKELEFIDVTKVGFVVLNDNVGSSPDGLVGDDGVLEIKCPNNDNFFKVVRTNFIDKKYMHQMQHQLYVTGRRVAYYMVYTVFNGEEMWHIQEVNRDDKMIELMVERTEEAIELRDKFVEELNNNKQF